MSSIEDFSSKYAGIGAGPAGLAAARKLKMLGIPFDGYETHSDVGGLWDIDNPQSTMYESAHLISSKRMTEFREFPMREEVADYPAHHEMRAYFQDYARHFGLYDNYVFNTRLEQAERDGEHWVLRFSDGAQRRYRGLLVANGTLSEPNRPQFQGRFAGRIMHSCEYKSAAVFDGKRVLVVGAGNSGCDIAVDACHRARSVDISMRRGYHFVPKFVFGMPADAIGGRIRLPLPIKQRVDATLLKMFVGDPSRLGFPEPDHKLYESHPIVNSMILYHAGHGDVKVRGDIDHFSGNTVVFRDGTDGEYDLVLLATGYRLHYPFLEEKHLNRQGYRPGFFLNAFHPEYDNLFLLGMIEASGIGWEGRASQAELVARFIDACERGTEAADWFRAYKRGPGPDLSGGMNYIKLDRMAYYVHKDTYLHEISRCIDKMKQLDRGTAHAA